MDTSNKYFTMCFEAIEIQELWKHSLRNSGDWYFHKKLGRGYVVTDQDQDDNECIWIPRQDQLQELAYKSATSAMSKLLDLLEFIKREGMSVWEDSLEIIWLKYVMNCCHSKKWDNENLKWKLL